MSASSSNSAAQAAGASFGMAAFHLLRRWNRRVRSVGASTNEGLRAEDRCSRGLAAVRNHFRKIPSGSRFGVDSHTRCDLGGVPPCGQCRSTCRLGRLLLRHLRLYRLDRSANLDRARLGCLGHFWWRLSAWRSGHARSDAGADRRQYGAGRTGWTLPTYTGRAARPEPWHATRHHQRKGDL